jgi:hypothetical protein
MAEASCAFWRERLRPLLHVHIWSAIQTEKRKGVKSMKKNSSYPGVTLLEWLRCWLLNHASWIKWSKD